MKDEIKEILDKLKTCIYEDDWFEIDEINSKILLDYITNLQEENKRLKQLCDKYEEEHSTTFNEWKETITDKYQTLKNLQEENERLKALNKEYVYELGLNEFEHTTIIDTDYKDKYLDYKSRNEKAIEYIEERKNLNWYADGVFVYELLNILNGGDEE